jgi:DNA-binding winged helix-turn-helix (wHTH) protein/TolB-like protein
MIQNSSAFLFDDVRVEPGTFKAFKAGAAIQLEPKTLRLMLFLIENRDRLIEKEEILNAIWAGTHVTENALAGEIAKLRKALGDDPKAARYIQTVHTRGYRFIGVVRVEEGSGEDDRIEPVEEENGFHGAAVVADSSAAVISRRSNSAKNLHSRTVLVFTGGLALFIVLGVSLWNRRAESKLPSTDMLITSVAVLPFKTSGASAADQYLGVELADALTTKLSNSKQLSVRSLTNVLHYASANEDARTTGSNLKVDYVLYGEIDRSQQQVSTHLIRVRDGAELFAEHYDEKFNNIFQLEDSLCTRVLSNLMVNLQSEEMQRLRRRYTENQPAYEAFLKGHYFMNKATKDDTAKGIDFFRQAIELDPKYAMAYAGLSDCYMRMGRFGRAPAEYVPQSRAAVMKALELDETVSYAHSMLGRLAFQYDWDFARAAREYARARELDPTLVHSWYAAYLMTLNRVAEAETEYKKFDEAMPFLPANLGLAQYFYLTHQYDGAVDLLNRKLAANSAYGPAHEMLGLVYEQQGRSVQAREEFQKAIALSGGDLGVGPLGHLYAISGKKEDARKALRKLDERAKLAYVSSYQRAVIHAGLAEQDEALKQLQKAYDERTLSAQSLRFDPRLNELRADPRFRDFMRRVGVTP